ncbi:MAG TPA: FHA domain-containing protein, partial [Gemmatimonadales bacterium]|nr:FHA domain-containing protein [Gemmatimonadales bacterium]
MSAQLRFLSGARTGQVESLQKVYSDVGRHPLSDVRCDPERDLDVSLRHASIVRDGDAFVIRDLDSTNGTFVNGQRLAADRTLRDGDVIGLGPHGPTIEFRMVGALGREEPSEAVRQSAERMSSPRSARPAVAAPAPRARPASTTTRIAAEVARQTRQLRRTTKLLIGLLAMVLAAFAWVQWNGA